MATQSQVDAKNRAISAREVRDFYVGEHRKYMAYLSSDGLAITTWMGDTLMRVTQTTASARRGFYGTRYTITYVRAVDARGQWWSGRGPGRGMYIRMTRLKRGALTRPLGGSDWNRIIGR